MPLGATSLQPALDVALEAFSGTSGSDRARSIIYIGDGMSTGKLVDMQEFRTLISQLRAQQIAVSSFAVGPRTDMQVLGVLAQHTGGVVLVEFVFQYPGIGMTLVDAVANRDIPVVQAVTMLVAAIYVLLNLGGDLATILLTPRLRTEARG